jgi:ATP-dependent DNA helicase RecG
MVTRSVAASRGIIDLRIIAADGEGQRIEFKAKPSGLAREMVAFANASGGSIFIGIADDGTIIGVQDSNRLRSEIQAVANACDPRVPIRILPRGSCLEIAVSEGADKPYRCSEGFFLRIGPNSQQLTRDEILAFAIKGGKVRFDEQFVSECDPAKHLDPLAVDAFRRQRKLPRTTKSADLLVSLGIAQYQAGRPILTRAALLFFGRDPQRIFREAYVTCARYADATRASVVDRIDAGGNLLQQFKEAAAFIQRNLPTGYRIETLGPRQETLRIPEPALREALLNALAHRDYFADAEHAFVHVHPDRVVITNPGGLPPGLTLQDLGTRAVPRNRLIADLFYRMGYVERLGSGIHRMRQAMAQAELPPPLFHPTDDAFRVTFSTSWQTLGLSSQEAATAQWLAARGVGTASELASQLKVSSDTARRILARLAARGWVQTKGKRRGAAYIWVGVAS